MLKKCLLVLILTYNVKKVILLENSRKTDRIARKPCQGKGFPADQRKPTELKGNPNRERVSLQFSCTSGKTDRTAGKPYQGKGYGGFLQNPTSFLQFPTLFITLARSRTHKTKQVTLFLHRMWIWLPLTEHVGSDIAGQCKQFNML